ncbi:ankyrin repeat containing protein [Coccidioides posadasii C735 delta SOWgp]|uniref:Ankyrin repeat containing protein n=1 Tax=Coccidioides posadasii (strain C735) TaxID=222929 RepID=C5PBE4_COCP7|nr:ankyrin repeat containing protein [Coccidioides posadasii C735 delta SOWgp]EER25928.1 ankyrin repeat containing protein [Coccidioides posadasii C735 delta SOWgp]|eukprot:XP_003068073.1 ankyrin repeat containing protein [Coccidioides posadasii C735 delta SOWgp]
MKFSILVLFVFASLVFAQDEWDDFYNNFATDLTPLLALFGEQVTKQFLSESTSLLDNVIFAAAPLGILTAIVSVIRVCGSPSLRAFIGRAQEGRGIAEVELCSSTSNDILELIYDKNNGAFYDSSGSPSKAHLFPSREYFQQKKLEAVGGREVDDGDTQNFTDEDPLEKEESPTSAGTVLLVTGMFLCAWLIETTTEEKVFKKRVRMYWLQQGGQTIGDQVFDAFAHSADLDEYMTSWKREGPITRAREGLVWLAVGSTSVGFVLQFVGLRGLHSFVALFQLGATVIMAIVRAGLRSQRLGEGRNELRDSGSSVNGHELDWFAHRVDRENCPQRFLEGTWEVYPTVPRCPNEDPGENKIQVSGLYGDVSESGSETMKSVIKWISSLQSDGTEASENPHIAARILYYRARLSRLTQEQSTSLPEEWQIDVRRHAQSLKIALEDVARIIFSGRFQLKQGWEDISAIFWTVDIVTESPDEGVRPIHVIIKRVNGAWRTDLSELEAILGLWIWSIRNGSKYTIPNPDKFFALVRSWDEVERVKLDLLTWVSGSLKRDFAVWECYDPEFDIACQDLDHLPVLSVPLSIQKRNSLYGYSQSFNCNAKALYVSTRHGLPLMCAQDIFTIFICRVVNAIQDISDFEPFLEAGGDTVRSQDGSFRLVNRHIDSIAEAFRNAGLGSREDALTSMIPILRAHSLLVIPENIKTSVLTLAAERRRKNDFVNAEDMLRWIYHNLNNGTPTEQKVLTRELGELYRRALQAEDIRTRSFGYNGILNVLDTFQGSERVDEIKQNYIWAAVQFASINQDLTYRAALSKAMKRNLADGLDNMSISAALKCEPFYPVCLIIATKWRAEVCDPIPHLDVPPLCLAARRGCWELVEDLLSLSFDINAQDQEGRTGMFFAAEWGHYDTVRCLLDYNAALGPNNLNQSPLWIAAANGHNTVVELLLENGANPEQQDIGGCSPLWIAAANQHEATVRMLLGRNADVNSRNIDGDTPLMATARTRSEAVLSLLLDFGADMNAKARDGYNALSYAISSKCIENISLFLDRGCHLEDRNGLGWTALLTAVGSCEPSGEMVAFLLDEGAYVEAKDERGRTPSLVAAEMNRPLEVIRALLARKAAVNATDAKNLTPLDFAVINRRADITQLLLEFGADTECKGNNYMTPLFQAVANGDAAIAELLLEHGADPSHHAAGVSVLTKSIDVERFDITAMLLKKGAFLGHWYEDVNAYFCRVMETQDEELVRLLLKHCKNLQAHWQILQRAEEIGNERIVKMLLDHGVRPYPKSPAREAAKTGKPDYKAI